MFYVPSAFTRSFVSNPQVCTSAGLLTIAHGFGVKPKMLAIGIQCAVSEAAFSVGEIVENISGNGMSAAATLPYSAWMDDNNIYIRLNENSRIFSTNAKNTGLLTNLTNSSWRIIAKVFA